MNNMNNGKPNPVRNNGGRPPQRRSSGPSGGGSNGGSNNGGSRRPMPSNGRRPGGHSGGGNSVVSSGNASNARNKYLDKAKEAMASGDRILAENFLQHADHYTRVLLENEGRRPAADYDNRPQTQAAPVAPENPQMPGVEA
jgi:hypothetical protein